MFRDLKTSSQLLRHISVDGSAKRIPGKKGKQQHKNNQQYGKTRQPMAKGGGFQRGIFHALVWVDGRSASVSLQWLAMRKNPHGNWRANTQSQSLTVGHMRIFDSRQMR
ncbi:hypothetical protein [Polaromonas naphthalenivorans]|uniref:hypothetical protein n=1 Tax=Polaromonas naphthalenivorans TaxID=216465 RepID=UPI001E4160AB|nr:hypothetical protein [Polaromonas naphthalenivorans]